MSDITSTTSPTYEPQRPALDVSDLPDSAFDWRDPVWWGNLLIMTIETTTIALLIASYFYLRRNFNVFPPPKVDVFPPIYDTAPQLKWGMINLILMIVSCAVVYVTDRYARRLRRGPVIIGLAIMVLVAAACTWLRWEEFHAVYFWWNDNAYASTVWMILGTHVTYLLATGLEFLIMLAWIITHEFESHHALDVTLAGGYWYWTAGTFLVICAVIYWYPRMI
jgi:heme/copper-type cytochrome/quinol oxidase subunit 3